MCETSPDISYGTVNPFAVLEGGIRDSGFPCAKPEVLKSIRSGDTR